MSTNAEGGLLKSLGRMFSGESLFLNEYTAQGGTGMIAFASSFPGSIIPYEVTPGNGIIVQKRGFLAMEKGLDLSVFFQKNLGRGLFGGLLRHFIRKNPTVLRLGISYLLPIVLGSILYQSLALSYFYFDGTLWAGFLYYLGTRTFQFSIMLVAEVSILFVLLKTKIFKIKLFNFKMIMIN